MTNSLAGKRALVCGGSRGIGRACAVEFARLGASVTLIARSKDALRQAVAQLDQNASQAHRCLVADFGDPASVDATVQSHLELSGAHQILLNNTGGPPAGPVLDASPEAFTAAFTHHVLCYQLLVQRLVPGMKASGYGRIINIISTSVVQPIMGLGVSNTIRGAVANWGRTLAGELAPFGITVNNLLPGYTDTDRLWSLFQHRARLAGLSPDQVKQDVVASIPLRRLAQPAEIGAVAAFLASPAAAYVTGVNLPVDGGRTAVQQNE